MTPRPLFASAATAAKLLDMKPSQFRTLVAEGVLPRPVEIGGETRWPVATLEALASGQPMDDLQW